MAHGRKDSSARTVIAAMIEEAREATRNADIVDFGRHVGSLLPQWLVVPG